MTNSCLLSEPSKSALALALLAFCGCCAAGPLDRWLLRAEQQTHWRLPAELEEVSALALTVDERLLAVDDERAVVFELDYVDGGVVKAFGVGQPPIREDFEGLAVHAGRVYLITSEGMVYEADEGQHNEPVAPLAVWDSGAGEHCEIEGLASASDHLFVLCKKLRKKGDLGALAIFRLRPGQPIDLSDRIDIPERAIRSRLNVEKLRPSGIALDPTTGTLILVAARQQALVELSLSGELIDARLFPYLHRHPQAEGVEVTADGRLLVADEGDRGLGHLAVYPLLRQADK